MGLKDYTDSHVGVAVAATAIVCSPRMREMLRRGAVHGVAGALMAGDAVASFARGVGRGAQQAAASTPAAPTVMEVAADGADAGMGHEVSADAPANAKATVKVRSPRKKARTDDAARVTEANPDE